MDYRAPWRIEVMRPNSGHEDALRKGTVLVFFFDGNEKAIGHGVFTEGVPERIVEAIGPFQPIEVP